MAGKRPQGRQVLLYDDDHYYMGGVLAELLVQDGRQVTLVTPASEASTWTRTTLEQAKIQARLIELGVEIVVSKAVAGVAPGSAELACVYTDRRSRIACESLVAVTARLPEDGLYRDLLARQAAWADAGIASVTCAGDAWGPSTIAAAVYAGRKFAEELDAPAIGEAVPFRREITELLPDSTAPPRRDNQGG